MKILLIVDEKNNWSVHNRAKAIVKYIPDWHFTIKDMGEVNPSNLNHYYKRYDIVHFCCGGIASYKYWFEQFPNTMTTSLNSHGAVSGLFQDRDDLEFIFERSAKVVALNKKLAGCFDNCVYIPNGVDIKLFKSRRRGKLVIGFAGTRTRAKGYDLIEKACQQLDKYVELLNDGSNHPEEYKTHREMVNFYNMIDVLILASDDEGSSNVVLEALACGKQVICTDVGNVNDLPGVVIIDKTIEDIKDGIKQFLPDLIIKEKWTWKQIAKRYRKMWIEVYKESKDITKHFIKRL